MVNSFLTFQKIISKISLIGFLALFCLFVILNFGHWNLSEICLLVLGILLIIIE